MHVAGDGPEPTPESERIRAAAFAAVRAWRDAEGFDAALLYGSAAWGDASEGSDGDVMLLFDRDGVWEDVVRVHEPASGLHFDVVRASWAAFERGLAGGWWLPRLAAGVILLDFGHLARLAMEARLQWRDPAARAARAAAAVGTGPQPADDGTGPAAVDSCRQATLSAAHSLLLARGVPPSGHHLLTRLRTTAGQLAVDTLAEGVGLPSAPEGARAQHDAAMALLRWARGVASAAAVAEGGSSAVAGQALRFGLSPDTVEEVEAGAAAWQRQGAWGQWGLASRDLARIAVLRNVAPLLGVPAAPDALAVWLTEHEPRLLPVWWEALGCKTWGAAHIAAAMRARATLTALAGLTATD